MEIQHCHHPNVQKGCFKSLGSIDDIVWKTGVHACWNTVGLSWDVVKPTIFGRFKSFRSLVQDYLRWYQCMLFCWTLQIILEEHVHQIVCVQSSNPRYLSQLGELSGQVICQAHHSSRKLARCQCRVEISLNEYREIIKIIRIMRTYRPCERTNSWMSDLFAFYE